MRAVLIFRLKNELDDGAIVEMVIWRLPHPVHGSAHDFKYRLYYGRRGRRVVGYDNERGKGGHRHVRGREFPYRFDSPEQLVADFLADVEDARRER
jgi:hypothetical protein